MDRKKFSYYTYEKGRPETEKNQIDDKGLCWNIIDADLTVRNIFDYNWVFNKYLYKVKKQYGALRGKHCDYKLFADGVRRELQCYFWARSQYEIILSGWIKKVDEYKLDVYTQVMLNWDRFIEYLWNNRKLIKDVK